MEDVFIFGIAMTGMILSYKLLSEMISRAKSPKTSRRTLAYEAPVAAALSPEEVDLLIARAQEMQKRIITLEEIVAAEQQRREA